MFILTEAERDARKCGALSCSCGDSEGSFRLKFFVFYDSDADPVGNQQTQERKYQAACAEDRQRKGLQRVQHAFYVDTEAAENFHR